MLQLKTDEFRRNVYNELNIAVEQIVHEEKATSIQQKSVNYLKGHPTEWDKVVELQQMMVTCE